MSGHHGWHRHVTGDVSRRCITAVAICGTTWRSGTNNGVVWAWRRARAVGATCVCSRVLHVFFKADTHTLFASGAVAAVGISASRRDVPRAVCHCCAGIRSGLRPVPCEVLHGSFPVVTARDGVAADARGAGIDAVGGQLAQVREIQRHHRAHWFAVQGRQVHHLHGGFLQFVHGRDPKQHQVGQRAVKVVAVVGDDGQAHEAHPHGVGVQRERLFPLRVVGGEIAQQRPLVRRRVRLAAVQLEVFHLRRIPLIVGQRDGVDVHLVGKADNDPLLGCARRHVVLVRAAREQVVGVLGFGVVRE